MSAEIIPLPIKTRTTQDVMAEQIKLYVIIAQILQDQGKLQSSLDLLTAIYWLRKVVREMEV